MDTLPPATPPLRTTADRRLAGQAARRIVPRAAHATWTPAPGRREPVLQVVDADAGRIAALLPIRYARMARDAHAFLRGTASIMAADLEATPSPGLRVQACGDAHLGNFGAYASPEGIPVFDVTDFDETFPAPFEWDVKRLAASLAVAARVAGQSDKQARALARRAAHGYRRHMDELSGLAPVDIWTSRIDLARAVEDIGDRDVRRRERQALATAVEASRSAYRSLVAPDGSLRLAERPPVVFRIGERDHEAAHAAFAAWREVLPPDRQALMVRYRLRDVAFKAVGIGSVGTFCAVGLYATADGDSLILQLKEARESVLAPYAGTRACVNQGERVVLGQRALQAASDAFLGWTPRQPDGRMFYVRQLKDAQLAHVGERLEGDSLRFYAQLCARTLARAHARTADPAPIAGYLGDGEGFDDAIAAFALAYADQVADDHAAFRAAISDGRIEAAAHD